MLKIVLSQILDRLIRSWGSLRRREGSGALKGSGVRKEAVTGERDKGGTITLVLASPRPSRNSAALEPQRRTTVTFPPRPVLEQEASPSPAQARLQ